MSHDRGFKIASTPDGASSSEKAGLVFTSEQECWQLKKGETTMIEFVAQTPGTYSFKCFHTCGLGLRGMKGQIIDEQLDVGFQDGDQRLGAEKILATGGIEQRRSQSLSMKEIGLLRFRA